MSPGAPRKVGMAAAASLSALLGYCGGYTQGRRSTTYDCYSNLVRIAGSTNLPGPAQLTLDHCEGIRISNDTVARFTCGSLAEAEAWLSRAREHAARDFDVDGEPKGTNSKHIWLRSPQCKTCDPSGEMEVESPPGSPGGASTCRVAFYGRSKMDFWPF